VATSVSFRPRDSDMGERRLEQIIGSSPALESVLAEVERVAPTDPRSKSEKEFECHGSGERDWWHPSLQP
jgi:hypothetical protein